MRRLIAFLHIVFIRLAGGLCALALYATARTVTDWSAVANETLISMAPLVVCLVFCWSPRLMRPLARPQHILDIVPLILVATVVPLAAMLYQTPGEWLLPRLDQVDRVQAAILAAPVLITGLALIAIPAAKSQASLPQIVNRRWIDGRPWHVYLGIDFVVMRCFGLGLLLVAAVLWRLLQLGQDGLAQALSFGQPIQIVFYGYAALGLLLTVPVFLPGFLRVPKGPGEGVLKAMVTFAVGIVLANAIGTLWPEAIAVASPIALPAFLTAIPKASILLSLQVVAALTAVFAVAVPMVRRAAGLRFDLEGRPMITLSGKELRQLRTARTLLN